MNPTHSKPGHLDDINGRIVFFSDRAGKTITVIEELFTRLHGPMAVIERESSVATQLPQGSIAMINAELDHLGERLDAIERYVSILNDL
jgi:hypothetical protein